MEVRGSCHCEKVTFSVVTHTPCSFTRCYCSICRKLAGSGGYGMDFNCDRDTLKVQGEQYLKGYQAIKNKETGEVSHLLRHFCTECGTHVYATNMKVPNALYAFSGVIDTPLPYVEEKDIHHIFVADKCGWVIGPEIDPSKGSFAGHDDISFEKWHEINNRAV
ncbi:Mss4-like protein [Dichotomocladium elegans]|nr:Mss4-like protein [Dichotomocladium elegans]